LDGSSFVVEADGFYTESGAVTFNNRDENDLNQYRFGEATHYFQTVGSVEKLKDE